MESFPNMLMIGGNARKSGKTTFICRLLEACGAAYTIGAAKIALYDDEGDFARHHPDALPQRYLAINEQKPGNKDSGKYLAAGAQESWFLAALPEKEAEVMEHIRAISLRNDLMVLESNILRKNIEPAFFVMINNPERTTKKSAQELNHLVDYVIYTGSKGFNEPGRYIGIENGRWTI
jgi:hypothetical protein